MVLLDPQNPHGQRGGRPGGLLRPLVSPMTPAEGDHGAARRLGDESGALSLPGSLTVKLNPRISSRFPRTHAYTHTQPGEKTGTKKTLKRCRRGTDTSSSGLPQTGRVSSVVIDHPEGPPRNQSDQLDLDGNTTRTDRRWRWRWGSGRVGDYQS